MMSAWSEEFLDKLWDSEDEEGGGHGRGAGAGEGHEHVRGVGEGHGHGMGGGHGHGMGRGRSHGHGHGMGEGHGYGIEEHGHGMGDGEEEEEDVELPAGLELLLDDVELEEERRKLREKRRRERKERERREGLSAEEREWEDGTAAVAAQIREVRREEEREEREERKEAAREEAREASREVLRRRKQIELMERTGSMQRRVCVAEGLSEELGGGDVRWSVGVVGEEPDAVAEKAFNIAHGAGETCQFYIGCCQQVARRWRGGRGIDKPHCLQFGDGKGWMEVIGLAPGGEAAALEDRLIVEFWEKYGKKQDRPPGRCLNRNRGGGGVPDVVLVFVYVCVLLDSA